MRKKKLFARVVDLIVPTEFLLSLVADKSRLIVLAYHRISELEKENYAFDFELVSANIDNFEYQVKFVKRHFNPITLKMLKEHVQIGSKLPPRPLLITFDDGFDDNYYSAFPILKKHGVPATIFVSTGYISTDEVIWFEKLVAIIKGLPSNQDTIDILGCTYQLNEYNRKEVADEILLKIKSVNNSVRVAALEELSTEYLNIQHRIDTKLSRMLTKEQIKEMSESVISFGSHTVSHPIMTKLPPNELFFELTESKRALEDCVDESVCSISYPNGNSNAFNKEVVDATEKAGYKLGFSYITGTNDLPLVKPFEINRLHVERYVDKSQFKALLCLPNIFGED